MLLWATLAGAGELEPRVWCEGSADHSYALYLPTGWTAERRWPLLIVLDPRGQAVPALHPFREAAERSGFVIASSWDSASDTLGEDPTPAAVAAMLVDLPARAHIASDQVVLAGFSGTARTAWAIGEAAPEIVLGVIGTGAATPDGGLPTAVPPFVWAGAAGTTDFNFHEVRSAEQWLRQQGAMSRMEPFEGPHQWPPAEVLGRSLDWIRLAAVARGRLPPQPGDQALEDSLLAHVQSLGPGWEGWLAASSLQALGVDSPARSWGRLKAVRRREALEARLGRAQLQALQRLQLVKDWLRDPQRAPPGVLRASTLLQVPALERAAARHAGTPRGDGATRTLEHLDASLSFYVPRELRVREDHRRVLASMQIAAVTGPVGAREQYDLACAHARVGQPEQALEALSVAIEAGFRDRWHAERDVDLHSLHGHPRFQELLGKITLEVRSAEGVFGFVGVSEGLEGRRGEFARAVAQASALVDEFAREHGWQAQAQRPLLRSVEIYERQQDLWARILALHGLPEQPLPTPQLQAALEEGVLLAVTPEASAALAPAYARQPDAWPRLLAHEMIHRLHVEILEGDEEAMGPPWFFEGFAVLGAGQELDTGLYVQSAAEALALAHDTTSPEVYARYEAAVRYFARHIPLPELVAAAGRPDFEGWLAARIP
jgi:predicted esterase